MVSKWCERIVSIHSTFLRKFELKKPNNSAEQVACSCSTSHFERTKTSDTRCVPLQFQRIPFFEFLLWSLFGVGPVDPTPRVLPRNFGLFLGWTSGKQKVHSFQSFLSNSWPGFRPERNSDWAAWKLSLDCCNMPRWTKSPNFAPVRRLTPRIRRASTSAPPSGADRTGCCPVPFGCQRWKEDRYFAPKFLRKFPEPSLFFKTHFPDGLNQNTKVPISTEERCLNISLEFWWFTWA